MSEKKKKVTSKKTSKKTEAKKVAKITNKKTAAIKKEVKVKNITTNKFKKTIKVKKDMQEKNSNKVLLTEDGLKKLQKELEFLKKTKRKEVANRLQEAISYGDLSENSEYEEAKNEQAFCEGRIVELEKMIKNSEVIDEEKAHQTSIIRVGTTVKIKNLEKEEDFEFTIVGSTEADPLEARISNESPIGKELIGKKKGDQFLVNAPGGKFQYKILQVK